MATRFLASALILGILLVAPLSSASHWTIHDIGLGESPRVTHEDDAETMTIGEPTLVGRTNRVVHPGTIPGDGGRFLDARLATHVGTFDLQPGRFLTELGISRTILAPGALYLSAWFGDWQDIDGDRVIDDTHDAACGSTACPEDEFIWEGLARGHALPIVGAIAPFSAGIPVFHGGGQYADETRSRAFIFDDHTALDEPEQEWLAGSGIQSVDGGLLARVQTFVIAGAKPAPGRFLQDLNDPAGLHDVDRYEAVNADIASLWSLALDTAFQASVVDARAVVADATDPIVASIIEFAGTQPPTLGEIASAATDVSRTEQRLLMPAYAKEPNTWDDDYEGRASFGGVGDAAGSHNSYSGYADGYHYYADVTARTANCAGVSVTPPGGTISVRESSPCLSGTAAFLAYEHADLIGAAGPSARTASGVMIFETRPILWWDRNGDTHIGAVCDPATPEFDAERNTCDPSAPTYPFPHAHVFATYEYVAACEASSAKGGEITLTPLGGSWGGAVVIRDYRGLGRAPADPLTIHADAEPITLRFDDACSETYATILRSRDAIMFPTGASLVPIRMEVESAIAGFRDTSRGIEIGDESVRDVDVLVPAL